MQSVRFKQSRTLLALGLAMEAASVSMLLFVGVQAVVWVASLLMQVGGLLMLVWMRNRAEFFRGMADGELRAAVESALREANQELLKVN